MNEEDINPEEGLEEDIKKNEEKINEEYQEEKYGNVMSNHSNVQVGEVVEKYRDSNGVLHKTGVDDVGFYVVIKMRDDIEKAKEISRGIRKGTLRSFSIGGQAISKRQRKSEEFGEYNEIEKLELHEVTVCEKGINPEAKFDILKMEEKEMSEKLEKALEELNDLMKQVNSLRKEEEEEMEKGDMSEMMDTDEDEKMMSEEEKMGGEMKMADEDEKMMGDKEEKALDEDSTRDYEAGEEVVTGGNPVATPAPLKVSKGLENSDFSTLDLSVENVEKAYEAFKAERLEAMAYESLNKEFSDRLEAELSVKKSAAERAEYDARNDVAALKEEFAELRKSLSAESDEIRKAKEVAFELPEGIPTNLKEASEISWSDIHSIVERYQ